VFIEFLKRLIAALSEGVLIVIADRPISPKKTKAFVESQKESCGCFICRLFAGS